jgi:hypothetical protein
MLSRLNRKVKTFRSDLLTTGQKIGRTAFCLGKKLEGLCTKHVLHCLSLSFNYDLKHEYNYKVFCLCICSFMTGSLSKVFRDLPYLYFEARCSKTTKFNPYVPRLPKWVDSMTCHNFDHRITPKRAIVWSFLKPVNFGTKKFKNRHGWARSFSYKGQFYGLF